MDVVEHQDKNQQIEVSYLVVGILGIIAGVMLVASLFHCMMLCLRNNGSQTTSRRRRFPSSQRQAHQPLTSSNNKSRTGQPPSIMTTSSTNANSDNKEEKLVEVCAVCLGEFEEGEVMRILPQCGHIYHVPCIDKWLASHSKCPLCRVNTVL
ncbi:hypothetical protein Leryth_018158 [Lithospermum erythrorhizon]|uniref:RING-type E3 ubiquitin transferase n=1 Tax=Lithospermum erythrorhizon TaxID=34254 RepID=A0AAV3PBU3_LITER|nr:hypothetical protein Leryth_018158 [Lithospermum erythrorhizon]